MSYVDAGYAVALGALGLYAFSLVLRNRRLQAAARAWQGDVGAGDAGVVAPDGACLDGDARPHDSESAVRSGAAALSSVPVLQSRGPTPARKPFDASDAERTDLPSAPGAVSPGER